MPAEAPSARPANLASQLRSFGPPGMLSVVVVLAGGLVGPIVGAILALVWARMAELPLSSLGLHRPPRWATALAGGGSFGVALKLALKAIVMPLLGAPAINASYHYLAGNTAALPGIVATIFIGAGFGEEVFFRGYLFERLGRLFGAGNTALVAATLASSALFALAHSQNQGLPGVEQAAVTGLVFGGIYAWRRELWSVIAAHIAFDLTAVALIYWNLEEPVAHLVFH